MTRSPGRMVLHLVVVPPPPPQALSAAAPMRRGSEWRTRFMGVPRRGGCVDWCSGRPTWVSVGLVDGERQIAPEVQSHVTLGVTPDRLPRPGFGLEIDVAAVGSRTHRRGRRRRRLAQA